MRGVPGLEKTCIRRRGAAVSIPVEMATSEMLRAFGRVQSATVRVGIKETNCTERGARSARATSFLVPGRECDG